MEASGDGVCTFDYEELQKILLQRGVEVDFEYNLLKIVIGFESWRCHRKSYKGSSRCIFHAEEKDPEEFKTSFNEELERMENEDEKFDFTGIIFPAEIDLSSKVFGKPVSFIGATFRERADFFCVTFQESVDFTGAEFQDVAEFTMAEFQKTPTFNRAKFKTGAEFIRTKFQGGATFVGAEFEGDGLFDEAEFHNEAYFRGVKFLSEARFAEVEFQRYTDFENAKFLKVARFYGTKFLYSAKFYGAEFRESAFFEEAKFSGGAIYNNVTFDGSVYFIKCSINTLIDFSFSTFNRQVLFRAAEDNQGYLVFFSTIFREPKITYIIGYPLSRVSFLLTNIEGIQLVPARAGNEEILDGILLRIVESAKAGRSGVGISTGNIPAENKAEIRELAKRLEPYLTPETVHAEYKRIRKCLEANRMFTEAADLFIKEMRLARKLLRKTNVFERLAHHIYEFVSRYGESVNRPIILAIATTLLASILLLPYNPGIGGPVPLHLLLTKYLENLEAVSAVFFQVRSFKDFSFLAKAPIAIEILIRVLAIIIFGNLFVAVRRRLERH